MCHQESAQLDWQEQVTLDILLWPRGYNHFLWFILPPECSRTVLVYSCNEIHLQIVEELDSALGGSDPMGPCEPST